MLNAPFVVRLLQQKICYCWNWRRCLLVLWTINASHQSSHLISHCSANSHSNHHSNRVNTCTSSKILCTHVSKIFSSSFNTSLCLSILVNINIFPSTCHCLVFQVNTKFCFHFCCLKICSNSSQLVIIFAFFIKLNCCKVEGFRFTLKLFSNASLILGRIKSFISKSFLSNCKTGIPALTEYL